MGIGDLVSVLKRRGTGRGALAARLAAQAVGAAVLVCSLPGLAGAQDSLAVHPHLARNLAATCAGCHGTDGAARGDMKVLAGMPADKMLAKIGDFKSGAEPATIMHQIAKGYTEEQLRLIAQYFAARPAPSK